MCTLISVVKCTSTALWKKLAFTMMWSFVLGFILGFENEGGILMQSEHFTYFLIFSPLCLYKNIPIPLKIIGDL